MHYATQEQFWLWIKMVAQLFIYMLPRWVIFLSPDMVALPYSSYGENNNVDTKGCGGGVVLYVLHLAFMQVIEFHFTELELIFTIWLTG